MNASSGLMIILIIIFYVAKAAGKTAKKSSAPVQRTAQAVKSAMERRAPTVTEAKQTLGRGHVSFQPTQHVHADGAKCVPLQGKAKYLAQLDNFLANGIIDKAEYKVLHERYNKLDL